MIKNKKTKKILSRFLAVLGVVVILVSVFAVPASAWEVTDIHFYNYFDINAVPSTTRNDGRQAYITSIDPSQGLINMSAIYTVNDFYYVPYQYSGLVLRDLLPDAVVGETYVLSGEYLDYTLSNTAGALEMRVNLVNSVWGSQKRWDFGEAITLTEEDLNANVTIWFANFASAEQKPTYGTTVSGSLRLWVNKDVAQPFVPYDILGELTKTEIEDAYWNGFNDGYNDGHEEGHDEGFEDGRIDAYQEFYKSSIFTRMNLNEFSFIGDSMDINVEQYELYEAGYNFDSFVFNPKGYYPSSFINADGFVSSVYVGFDAIVDGKYLQLGDLTFTMPKVGDGFYSISIMIYYYDDDNILQFKEYDALDLGDYYFFNSSTAFDLNRSTLIEKVRFCYWYEFQAFNAIEAFDSINIKAADTASPSYLFGYESGFKDGEGYGSEYGYNNGYDEGYSKGTDEGYSAGMTKGETSGYNKGYADGREVGEGAGYDEGYYAGRADEAQSDSFFDLIFTVVDAPIKALSSTLNFEILGVNMGGVFYSLITFMVMCSVCLLVVKLFF